MILKRSVAWLLAAAVCITILTGCDNVLPSDSGTFGIYYINSRQTGLEKIEYSIVSDVTSDVIRELLAILSTETVDDEYINPIPQELGKVDYDLADHNLILRFEPEYTQLTGTREILTRSAVAKTFLQLEEVGAVSFYIGDEPLKGKNGNVIGAMTTDSFLDNFGENEEALESDTFTLYYSSRDGQGLIKKTRLLHFNNTMSRESVVMTYLSKDPGSDDGAKAVLASNVKVLSATSKDGICYVKLDANFLSQQTGVATETAVYGIVDSLTSLDDIGKVELSVEGTAEGMVPDTDRVSGLYEKNESLVIPSN